MTRANKIKKISAFLLLASQLVFFPLTASAQLFFAPQMVYDSNNGTNVDPVTGNSINLTVVGSLKAADSANQACAITEQTYFKTDTAVQFGMGGLDLISGGAALKVQLHAKISAIEGFITCREAVRTSLFAILTPNTYTATVKQNLMTDVTNAIASLKVREDPLKSQLNVVDQGFWKTLVFNILIKTTQSVSGRMLNKLVSNYGIKNFTKYADALATQVYDNQLINQRFSGAVADQLIIRSMLNNPLTKNEIDPAVFQKANDALGFDPTAINPSSSNFSNQLFMIGSAEANPYMQQIVMQDQARQVHQDALQAAQKQIDQSNGIKTPWNCPGTLAQQQSIDQNYKIAAAKVEDRRQLLQSLLQARDAGKNVSASDIAKATADYGSAQQDLQKIKTTGAAADDTGAMTAALTICKDIVSPPSLIDQGIKQALNSMGQSMSTYNNNNLPFFINAITSIATQYTNSLIFGGQPSGVNILKENVGSLATMAELGTAYAASGQVSSSNNLIFTITPSDGQGSDPTMVGYNLSWSASGVASSTYIVLTGTGLPASMNNQPNTSIDSNIAIQLKGPGTYTFSISAYNSRKQILASTGQTLTVPAPGSVNGAFISKLPPLGIRTDDGAQNSKPAVLGIRGNEDSSFQVR